MATTKFKPGQSGNPAGRPKGTTAGSKIRKAIDERRDDILKSVINAAVNGDMQACKMLLDRITPPLKPVAANVQLSLPDVAGLAEQGAAVVNATLSGTIPPDVGSQLITALSNQAKLVEVDELVKRVEALEAKGHA